MPIPTSLALRQFNRPIQLIVEKLAPQISRDQFNDPSAFQRLIRAADELLVVEAPQARLLPKKVREAAIAGVVQETLGPDSANTLSSLASADAAPGELTPELASSLPEEDELGSVGLRGLTVKYAANVNTTEAVAKLRQILGDRIVVESFPSLPRVLTVKLTSNDKPMVSEAWEAARNLVASGSFEYAEPNLAIPAMPEPEIGIPTPGEEGLLSLGPGDWDRNHPSTVGAFEWSLDRINAKAFWNHPQGSAGRGILVGHIDTGYTLHPELKPNLDRNRDYDFWNGDADAQDPLGGSFFDRLHAFPVLNPGHGTGTGSVIASPTGKQSTTAGQAWVTGTAPEATLIPYRATPSVVIVPGGSQDEVARAVIVAADAGVDVISMSLGSPWDSALLRESIEHALNAGVIVCAAAGNVVAEFIQGDRVTYPAKCSGVVAVAGCDYDYAPWSRSCRGPEVDITAPGTDVWRAVANENLNNAVVERGSGTSFAVATIAGVAACWVGRHGGRETLRQHYGTARLIPGAFLLSLRRHTKIPLTGGDPSQFGGGVIDANALANLALPSASDVTAVLSDLSPAAPTNLNLLESISPSEAGSNEIASLFEESTRLSVDSLMEDEIKEFCTHLASQQNLLTQWNSALLARTSANVPAGAVLPGSISPRAIGEAVAFGLSPSLAGRIQDSEESAAEAAMKAASAIGALTSLRSLPVYSSSPDNSLKCVVVYTMHEWEMSDAVTTLSAATVGEHRTPPEQTEGFVMGDATKDEIEAMRARGLIVEEVSRGVSQAQPSPLVEVAPSSLFSASEAGIPRKFLMRMTGPMLASRREQLKIYNVRVLEALPNGYYRVETTPTSADDLTALSYISEIVPELQTGPTQSSFATETSRFRSMEMLRTPIAEVETAPAQVPYDIWLKQGANAEALAAQLTQMGYIVIGAIDRKIRILTTPASAQQQAVQQLPDVELMEQYIEPELHNDHARRLLGLDPVGNPPVLFPWTGKGQTVAIADTGIDSNHPDFQGRLRTIVALGRPGITNDPHGHGTHVAGSALGDGAGSGGVLAGMAPGAELYFQSILGPGTLTNPYPLSGLPIALSALFDPPYIAGARIHNNSWGALASSFYRLSSREVDEYVRAHPDMLIVISAGNEGTTRNPVPPAQRRSASGLVDWYSLGAPATSKNALTVGASQSDIAAGGYSSFTHNAIWPQKFPLANVPGDIAAQNISGVPSEIAGFSSRGTSDSTQIKSDVVAPGTDIASAKSSLAPSHHFSGPYAGNPLYSHMCGTSMAAPLVSGCAAVAREYFETVHQHAPSAALLKAVLVNGTDALNGAHSMADPGGFPNGHQGFGRINMRMSLPHPTFEKFDLFFYDNWQTKATHLAMGNRQRFTFDLPAGQPWLRLCLAYTDLPGDGVQNKLLLLLHHVPSNTKCAGNDGQLAKLAPMLPSPDRNNNVAIIRLTNPLPGTYFVQVTAANMPFPGIQDFALVITSPSLGQVDIKALNQ